MGLSFALKGVNKNTYAVLDYVVTYKFCCCCLVPKLCLALCDPVDCSPSDLSVHGISQARILEQVVISFSRGSSWPRDGTHGPCIGSRFFTAEPPGKPQEGFENNIEGKNVSSCNSLKVKSFNLIYQQFCTSTLNFLNWKISESHTTQFLKQCVLFNRV